MSTIPGLFVAGEANFSDHGANRLGASALMQGLADGYFVLPVTIGHYLAGEKLGKVSTDHDAFKQCTAQVQDMVKKFLSNKGGKTVLELHRELGKVMREYAGLSRSEAGLQKAIGIIDGLRQQFWKDVRIVGGGEEFNKNLEMAGRVADYFELGDLMARDAMQRKESCGGHFREEYETPEGEAMRDDQNFMFVSAWEYAGVDKTPVMHKEPLKFENVKPSERSYK
jgi:succinate dehydrogenase / fumarate reductase flavoprotein subunit